MEFYQTRNLIREWSFLMHQKHHAQHSKHKIVHEKYLPAWNVKLVVAAALLSMKCGSEKECSIVIMTNVIAIGFQWEKFEKLFSYAEINRKNMWPCVMINAMLYVFLHPTSNEKKSAVQTTKWIHVFYKLTAPEKSTHVVALDHGEHFSYAWWRLPQQSKHRVSFHAHRERE